MVFSSHTSRVRTLHTRVALAVCALIVCGALVHFRYALVSPQAGCADSCLITYTQEQKPSQYLALTFDDGPAGPVTESILSTLEQYGVPATFFLVGENIMKHPEQVRAIAAAGHTIGNHTFTSNEHRVHESRKRITEELDRTNTLIESLTGRSAVMYRPPSLIDLEPFEVVPEEGEKPVWDWVYGAGYVPVGVDLDSNDWRVTTAEEVFANMRAELESKKSVAYGMDQKVILLHDLPHTAEALPKLIETLLAEGYEIVPLTSLLGLTSDEVMPKGGVTAGITLNRVVIEMAGVLVPFLKALALLITTVALGRVVVFLWFKLYTHRKKVGAETTAIKAAYPGTISVLVPAYNEGKNIRATLYSILTGSRTPDEVLIIDDGSTDDTLVHAEAVRARFPETVRVIRKENGGKSSALNMGIAQATGDIVVAIDGDTVLDALCIETLSHPFSFPEVGATAGKIIPASTSRLMERFQYLEYVVGQNIDKEFISHFGAVNVVPGAVGAWRRVLISDLGGYSADTLVEDQDLTLAVLGAGHTVTYVPEARAYTEVPTTLRSFYLQRFRWVYGTFQCMWKYRGYFGRRGAMRLGLIALPYALLFNIILPLFALILNAAFLATLFSGATANLFWLFLAFALIDMVYAFAGLLDEGKERRWCVFLVPFQRLAYLGLYSVIMALVTLKVVDGSTTRWNKLTRIGSAEAYFRETLARLPPPHPLTDIVMP